MGGRKTTRVSQKSPGISQAANEGDAKSMIFASPCHWHFPSSGVKLESDQRATADGGSIFRIFWSAAGQRKISEKPHFFFFLKKRKETTKCNTPLPLSKYAHKLWQEHRGESRWSPFHPIPCGNFRGLFPNPFKWTFHLSASSSVSAIPTVQPFLHHFLHNLAGSRGQNKCLWEIWSAHIGSMELTSRPGRERE